MSTEIPLESMSVSEKIFLLERVWDSLCSKSGDVRSPEWHREVVETRKRRHRRRTSDCVVLERSKGPVAGSGTMIVDISSDAEETSLMATGFMSGNHPVLVTISEVA